VAKPFAAAASGERQAETDRLAFVVLPTRNPDAPEKISELEKALAEANLRIRVYDELIAQAV
jgi:hypothetical protein